MLDKLKLTVKHTFFYALGNIAPKLSGFILLPIYTKSIPLSDYGILGLLEVIEVFLAQILGLGLSQAQLRWYGLAPSESKKKSYLLTITLFILAVSFSNIILILWGNEVLSTIIFGNKSNGYYLFIIAVTVSLSILHKIPLTLLRSEQKSNWYALTIFIQFSINLISNIYFLIYLKKGLLGVLYSQLISAGLVFVFLIPYLIPRIAGRLDFKELGVMLKFGFPIALSSLSAIILNLGDRYILAKVTTLEQVGLYSLGYKISNILKVFIIDAFILTLPTVAWKMLKEDDHPRRFFSKTMTYYTLILLWGGLSLAAFHKGLIHQFALNKLYWDAAQVVPFLILGVIFYGMTGFFYFILQIPMKTQKVVQIIAGAAVVNILLNLVLIPQFGMIGAAVATIIAQLIGFIFAYQKSQEAYRVEYEVGRLIMLFSVAIITYFTTTLFDVFSLFQRIFCKGVLILSFPAILYFLNFYSEVELARIKGSIKKWGGKVLFKG